MFKNYISDLTPLKPGKTALYADDSPVIFQARNRNLLAHNFNKKITPEAWYNGWLLQINTSKTKVIVITKERR